MTLVSEAQQEQPVRRRVALKLIKRGMNTRAVVSRFRAERQALALMNHPGIARVFDVGATDDGRPYFAMELVDGEPITTRCQAGRIPVEARRERYRDRRYATAADLAADIRRHLRREPVDAWTARNPDLAPLHGDPRWSGFTRRLRDGLERGGF
jgi:serine/threonine protein kinase